MVTIIHERLGLNRPLDLLGKKLVILNVLKKHGVQFSFNSLASHCNTRPQQIRGAVTSLNDEGYIEFRVLNPEKIGKRTYEFLITQEGRGVLKAWDRFTKELGIE